MTHPASIMSLLGKNQILFCRATRMHKSQGAPLSIDSRVDSFTLTETQNFVLISKTNTTREGCTRKHEKRPEAREQWTSSRVSSSVIPLYTFPQVVHMSAIFSIFFLFLVVSSFFFFLGQGFLFPLFLPDGPSPDPLLGQTPLRRTPSSAAGASQDVQRARMCVVKNEIAQRPPIPRKTSGIGKNRCQERKNSAKFWHPPRPPPPGPLPPGPPFALQPPHPPRPHPWGLQ